MYALLRILAAASSFVLAASARAAPSRPNLVVLMLDDHSLLDEGLDVMPHYAQRFAAEGLRLSNAFVASPKCCPSRTSMLSGRFAHRLNDQVDGWCGDFLAQGRHNETFAVALQAAGYATSYFGKFINTMGEMCPKKGAARGVVPRGFDAFVAMCNEAYYNVTWTVDGALTPTGDAPGDYAAAFLGNASLPWLARAAAAAAGGGAPFFAFLAPHAPHLPATPAPWHAGAALPSAAAPRPPNFAAFSAGKSWNVVQDARRPFSPATLAGIDTHFANRQRTLLSVDDLVRDVFAALEAAGVLDNTFVFATSDHGYHFGEFGLPFEKSTPYETDVRVPFYVRGPGVAAGAAARGAVSLMDIGATLLDLAGAAPPARATDGVSIAPLLRAGGGAAPPGWRDAVLIEHVSESNQWMNVCDNIYNVSGCPFAPADDPYYLIDGPQNTWAMLRVVNESHDVAYVEFRPQGSAITPQNTNWTEYYDLARDPYQRTNAANTSDVRALRAALWAVADCALDSCP